MTEEQFHREDVEFPSLGATLRGWLYLPVGADGEHPVVVMAHGFTATRTMTIDKYAEAFARAGFAALVYDHRSLGASDGLPRQEVNIFFQARGYLDALDYLTKRRDLDASRIALWGDSISVSSVMLAAAVDARFAAIIGQVPAFGFVPPPVDKTGRTFDGYASALKAEDMLSLPCNRLESAPIVTPDPKRQPCSFTVLTAWRWFMEYGSRLNSGWVNDVIWSELIFDEPFHPAHCAEHITAPTFFVPSYEEEIETANPDFARDVLKRINAPKRLLEIPGGHFGLLYYPSGIFDEVATAQIDFMREWL